MFINYFSTVCVSSVIFIIYANVSVAAIVRNGHNFPNHSTGIDPKTHSESRQPHSRPHFKIVQQPTLEHFASIKNPKRKIPVHRSIVQVDVDSGQENEVDDYSDKEWQDYKDDGDDYDDNGNKFDVPEQNHLTNHNVAPKPEQKSKQIQKANNKMTKFLSNQGKGHYRDDFMVGSPKTGVYGYYQSNVASPRTPINPTYSTSPFSRSILITCQPIFPRFGCVIHAYDYHY